MIDRTSESRGAGSAGPTDQQIGQRIRACRLLKKVSQEELGAALGVSFQQIQKYERGFNRVSASKLWEIGQALETPVSYFFEGLDNPPGYESGQLPGREREPTSEELELMLAFQRIPDEAPRRRIIELVQTLVDDPGEN